MHQGKLSAKTLHSSGVQVLQSQFHRGSKLAMRSSVGTRPLITSAWLHHQNDSEWAGSQICREVKHCHPPCINNPERSLTCSHNDWANYIRFMESFQNNTACTGPRKNQSRQRRPPQFNLLLVSDDSCRKTWEQQSWTARRQRRLCREPSTWQWRDLLKWLSRLCTLSYLLDEDFKSNMCTNVCRFFRIKLTEVPSGEPIVSAAHPEAHTACPTEATPTGITQGQNRLFSLIYPNHSSLHSYLPGLIH